MIKPSRVQQDYRNLYPVLRQQEDESHFENVQRPFSVEQLRTLYYNHELERAEEFVDAFVQVRMT